jgi:hypothetical protein
MLAADIECDAGELLPRKISTPTQELAKEILSYFLRNPQAADSLKGVARWRLLEERVHRQIEDTDEALEWLVRNGFLVRVSPAWSEAVYQLNPKNRPEAERFLSKSTKRMRKPPRN